MKSIHQQESVSLFPARLAHGVFGLCLVLCLVSPAAAQHCTPSTLAGTVVGFQPLDVDIEMPNNCFLYNQPCYEPEQDGATYPAVDASCDGHAGACPYQLWVPLKFPGNSQITINDHVNIYWFNQANPPEQGACPPDPFGDCPPISYCGYPGGEILVDRGETFIQVSPTCDDIRFERYQGASFSLSAVACQSFLTSCTERLDVPDIQLPSPDEMWDRLGCDAPKPQCKECSCKDPGDPDPANNGPGAQLHYQKHGVGYPGHPGTEAWNQTLGRYWSHDYAWRIVLDPVDSDDSHVWLLTETATFVEFRDLEGGVYQTAEPSDEYRQLSRTGSGWTFRELDGTEHLFGQDGRWLSTEDRHGNAKEASYTAERLTRVDFPDGRSEVFDYNADGKLSSITEIGVGAALSRTWSYTWSGLDLVRIDRPDGTAWALRYDDPRHPGLMTRMTLVGTDGGERIEGAWEYDRRGNTVRSWKGDVSFSGPDAVEGYSFTYDNPYLPQTKVVTDPLGNATTYELGRDPGGVKPRIESTSGGCGSCGSGPNSRQYYDDPLNPLKVTRSIDASGVVTLFEYNEHGQMTARTEAFMTDLERTTTWEYDETHPGLLKAIEVPSTSGFGVRRTSWTYDGEGNAIVETQEGYENGEAFLYETVTSYNSAGMVEWIDPPGYGTEDRTTFAYDPGRGNLVLESRTDPLVGTTRYGYDAFNRRIRVTDPNGLVVETTYDSLGRLETETIQGTTTSENQVTRTTYTPLGDLYHTLYPAGGVVEYGYDSAGRLISIENKPGLLTHGERTFYTLNASGRRILEELQTWGDEAWKTESWVGYEYGLSCQLSKVLHVDGSVTENAYDCEGRLSSVWDANHPSNDQTNLPSRSLTYDIRGRLRTITVPWGGVGGGAVVTQYEYDVQDHAIKIVDANGTATSYTYSDRNLVTKQISEISGTTTYIYGERGYLTHQTDARGITVERVLDAAGRVRLVKYPDDSLDIRNIYDDPQVPFSKGRLTAITRGDETVEYRYDRLGRLTQDGDLTYDYDLSGNRTVVGYPGGVTAYYTYDPLGREETLYIQDSTGPLQPVVTSTKYKASGALTNLIFGNGLQEIRRYTALGSLEGIQVGSHMNWEYTTDSIGNVTAIQDALDPVSSRSFGYQDYQYYLTQSNGPWGTLQWTYDKIGNRLTENRNDVVTVYAYKKNTAMARSPQLTSTFEDGDTGHAASLVQYHYDSAGGLTVRSGRSSRNRYRYDVDSRMSLIRGDSISGPIETTLEYDGRSFLAQSTLRLGID